MFDEVDEDFEKLIAEKKELEVLLDKGLVFSAGGKQYLIKQPFLGTLDYLSNEFLKLDFNSENLNSDNPIKVFDEQKRIVQPNVKICARIVAIAVLNSRWKIKFLTGWYAAKFRWSVTPEDLFKLTNIVLQASNLRDFTNSIALLSINRTTAPAAIED